MNLHAEFTFLAAVPNTHGDTWSATWADDGNFYTTSDDTNGVGGVCHSNLAINVFWGRRPHEIRGETVNAMPEYGEAGQEGADGATWKANGIICVDGVLYVSVSRHRYAEWPFFIQQTWDASIIKSVDHGKSWSSVPAVDSPMFLGRGFSTPIFVQYGRDGRSGDRAEDHHVYAVSNDGSWNNGNHMVLGRVPRNEIGNLDGGDWEFWKGLGEDGTPMWGHRAEEAKIVFRAPGRTSMAGVQYLDSLGMFVLPQWHYLDGPNGREVVARNEVEYVTTTPTKLEFFLARQPWGPWEQVFAEVFEEGLYNPAVVPGQRGDANKWWVFVAGLGGHEMENYRLNVFELSLTRGALGREE